MKLYKENDEGDLQTCVADREQIPAMQEAGWDSVKPKTPVKKDQVKKDQIKKKTA
jgi:hypothetical protein